MFVRAEDRVTIWLDWHCFRVVQPSWLSTAITGVACFFSELPQTFGYPNDVSKTIRSSVPCFLFGCLPAMNIWYLFLVVSSKNESITVICTHFWCKTWLSDHELSIHRPTDSSRQNPTVEPPCATVFCCTQWNGNGWMGWDGSDVEIKRRAEAKWGSTSRNRWMFVSVRQESIRVLHFNWKSVYELRLETENEWRWIDWWLFHFLRVSVSLFGILVLTFGVLNTYRYQIQGVFFLKKYDLKVAIKLQPAGVGS